MSMFLRSSAVGMAALLLVGCSTTSKPAENPREMAKRALHERIRGQWRVASYVPATTLNKMLLATFMSDTIIVVFENGRVRSATPTLSLDRKFRVEPTTSDTFKMYVADEQGVEYESWCQFDRTGKVQFETKTEPWIGRGLLERLVPPTPR